MGRDARHVLNRTRQILPLKPHAVPVSPKKAPKKERCGAPLPLLGRFLQVDWLLGGQGALAGVFALKRSEAIITKISSAVHSRTYYSVDCDALCCTLIFYRDILEFHYDVLQLRPPTQQIPT